MVEFDPQFGTHPFDRDAVCPCSRIVVHSRPHCYMRSAHGDYKILRSHLLSEKTAVETYINMKPGPYILYSAAACPQSNFFRVETQKSWPRPHMNSAAVWSHRLKHFYFDRTLILKIVALKQLSGKILNTVAAHI
jgi:hypothetical protein